jgi:ABC-type multidrug transport system fused ATPase/permease subunit
MPVLKRLRARQEWIFFAMLPQAAPGLAFGWWLVLVTRGVLPVIFGIAMGVLVGAVQHGTSLTASLLFAGVAFILLQVLIPIHTAIGANLGDRSASWLYDQLTEACVRPPGMGHLEDATLTNDLTVARDFDLGMTGPPLSIAMDFAAGGLVKMISGVASAIVLAVYAWWAPILLGGAWLSTHWLLKESAVWRDRNTAEVRGAQRDADYAYRLAVDAPAAKELRLFGLADWTLERFKRSRTRLHQLQYEATRIRERPLLVSLLLVGGANLLVFWSLAHGAAEGRVSLAAIVVFAQAAIGTSSIAFGGLNWVLDGAAAPVHAVMRLEPAMRVAGALPAGTRSAERAPQREIRFRDVSFAYGDGPRILDHLYLVVPAGSSLAIVGQNGAGKTTLAKLLCRLYDPQSGAIEADGVDLRNWTSRPGAVASRRSSRTSCASSCRFATTSRPAVHRTPPSDRHSNRPAPRIWPRSTRFSRAVMRAAPTCPAGNGSASRWRARCAPCNSAPVWCCSMSRPPSSTSAARPRSSTACCAKRATVRPSSSHTVFRRSGTPTGSACSNTAASSSSGHTTN